MPLLKSGTPHASLQIVMIKLTNILVATDFSRPAEAALAYGRTLAEHFGASLHVLHVARRLRPTDIGAEGYVADLSDLQRDLEEAARNQLDECLAGKNATSPRTRGLVVTSNSPAKVIVDYANSEGIDLIVVGTEGRGGMSRLLLGSVAERVVRTAPCPVLTVHHPEREFVLPEEGSLAAARA